MLFTIALITKYSPAIRLELDNAMVCQRMFSHLLQRLLISSI